MLATATDVIAVWSICLSICHARAAGQSQWMKRNVVMVWTWHSIEPEPQSAT